VTHHRQNQRATGRKTRFNSPANRPVTSVPSSHGGLVRSRRTSMAGHRPKAANTSVAAPELTRPATNMAWANHANTGDRVMRRAASPASRLPRETWPGRGLPIPGYPALAARLVASSRSCAPGARTRLRAS
jgi:hypothetical protein